MLLQLVHQRLTLQAAILTTELDGSRFKKLTPGGPPIKMCLAEDLSLHKTQAEALTVFMGPSWRLS